MVLFQNSHLSFQCYIRILHPMANHFCSLLRPTGGPLRLRHNVWTPGWFGWKDDWWDIHECPRATQRFSPVTVRLDPLQVCAALLKNLRGCFDFAILSGDPRCSDTTKSPKSAVFQLHFDLHPSKEALGSHHCALTPQGCQWCSTRLATQGFVPFIYYNRHKRDAGLWKLKHWFDVFHQTVRI